MEGPETEVPPWELDEETEQERKLRYKREAEEMKLKWDARRLEEKQSAERRRAFAAKERERASYYGPRDKIMEAYDARMYEEARVIEVRRRQREVYERIKAFKLGKPLPPKGEPYVPLRPPPETPPMPEDFDVSGRYDPRVDIEEQKYRAPESYVSSGGPAPPPQHLRGPPRAAWEDEPYGLPPMNPRPAPDIPTPEEVLEEMKANGNLPELSPEAEAKGDVPAAASDALSKDEIMSMKVVELKGECSKRGLTVSGTKADLQKRLLGAM